MKPLRNLTAVLLGLLIPFQSGIAQQMTQEPEVVIMPAGETLLRWFAQENRTYFIQASDPNDHLSTWIWSSLIESGQGQEISHEVGGTADKGFFRLHYTDALPPSGVTLEDWDADSDSLSNALELSLQGNPLNSDSSGDGIPDGWAYAHGLSLSANSASGLFQGGPATNFQAFQQGVQAIPGATLQDHDGDLLDNDLDAVPEDGEINWQKTTEKRYVWIEQVTQGGAKAVSKHGHILFPKENVGNPGTPNPENVLWDSNTSSWVELTGASSWDRIDSGFISGNTPDVFDARWLNIDDMNDEGVVIGRSKTVGPFDNPIGWVVASAIMKWQMTDTATDQYDDPIYIVPGFDYVAPWGDLKEILVEGTPRIADDGTVSAVSTFLENGNLLPADAQWVASGAQVADHTNEMAEWTLFDMATYWPNQFHSGAVIGAAGGLLVEHQSSIQKTILHYRNGAAAENLEGLIPNTAYAINDTDIGKTPVTSESPEGRIWFSVNHAGGDAAFLEKRAGGSGVSRWHNPPSMSEGAIRLNARGEAITLTKVWRNGIYTPINELVSKPASSQLNITKLIDLASNGIILAESTGYGVTKTGLLVPVDLDVDADNTTVDSYPNSTNGDRGAVEEASEDSDDEENHPGVRVYGNFLDFDEDYVPGYADGIEKFGNGGSGACDKFEPMLLDLGNIAESFPDFEIAFKYDDSDPNQLEKDGDFYNLPEGKVLRIWKKDGGESRKPASANAGGDFIKSEQAYKLEDIGQLDVDGVMKLFIEVVGENPTNQSYRIVMELYPKGKIQGDKVELAVKVRPCRFSQENPIPYLND